MSRPALYRHRFANAEFDEAQGTLTIAGQLVKVEPRPLRLLSELLQHVNEVVTKEELFQEVWEGRPTVDNVLANAVNKLRSALGDEAGARLVNVPRVGYKLLGPIERVAVGSLPPRSLNLAEGLPLPGREGFVLVRALGSSSRRSVWLARHAKLGTERVFKFATDADELRHLKREFTLYRVLKEQLGERPDFARVLDANFQQSPFYLECEFGGPDMLSWADDSSHLASMPPVQRLPLFLAIARAVSAAHDVGVLHKDLKPANVLVTGTTGHWLPCLTDFGSARALSATQLEAMGLTAMGMTITESTSTAGSSLSGTPMYLPPEVVAGHSASLQSDVYALGLMLYQIMVGDLRRPLATGWVRDIDDGLLREDIAAATEGRPELRLKTVAALVERLESLEQRRQRQKQHEADAERSVKALDELQRARARKPWIFGAIASLALGLTASMVFALQTRQALQTAQAETSKAAAISNFMSRDLLSGVDVNRVDRDSRVPMREVLDRASSRATERFKAQPKIEAVVRGQLAGLYYQLSLWESAETEFRRALTLADDMSLRNDPDILRIRFDLVGLLAVHDKYKEAQSMLVEAERDAGPLIQGNGRLALSAALARVKVLAVTFRFQEALPHAERLVALADDSRLEWPEAWFNARMLKGEVLFRMGEPAKAEAVLAPLTLTSAAGGIGPALRARALITRARALVGLGRADEAEPALIEGRDTLMRHVGPQDHTVGLANDELGNIYSARGDFSRAREAHRAAHTGYVQGFGKEHPAARTTALNLAISELNLGHTAQALAELEAGRSWFVANTGGESSPVAQAIDFERARAMTTLGRAAEAAALLAKLDAKSLATASPASDWRWRLQAERGRALIMLGQVAQSAEGRRQIEEALGPMAANGGPPWVVEGYRRVLGAPTPQAQ